MNTPIGAQVERAADATPEPTYDCERCGGTGIGIGKLPDGRFMETDCSDCDGSGSATPEQEAGRS